jgi:hypothetical protein
MRAETLPAAAGWRWVLDGFAIFRRNPPLLSMLVVCYWLLVIFLNVLPVIGPLAASLAIPGLSVGLMQAARDIEREQPGGMQTLFAGFKRNAGALLALGALYLVCTLAALGASALADGGELLRFMISGKPADPEALAGGDLLLPALLALVVMAPVMMAWWFAPLLVAWHGAGIGKALFFSLVACWMNRAAFLVYGAGLLLVAGILPGIVYALLLVLFPAAQAFTTALVTVPLLLMVAPAIFASFYATYRDVFGQSELA